MSFRTKAWNHAMRLTVVGLVFADVACLAPAIVGDPGCHGTAVSSGEAPTGTFQSGSGTSVDPYVVCTAEQLQSVGSYLSSYFKQKSDVDLNGVFFTPIGAQASPFMGTYDGNNKTISNFGYNNVATTYAGLFGYVGTSGVVTNLTVSNAAVTAGSIVGIVAGGNFGTMSNVHATGSVSGGTYTGGLVGGGSGTLTTCSTQVTVTTIAAASYVGGVIGGITGTGSVSNCSAQGTVTASTSDEVGGIAGVAANGSSILYSSSSVTVAGRDFVGGIVGDSQGATITRCVSTGNVTGDDYVAGIVGAAQMNALVLSKSYATGTVTASGTGVGAAGGIVGGLVLGSVSNSFYLNTSAGAITLSAGVGGGGVAGAINAGTSVTNSFAVTGAIAGAGALKACFNGWDTGTTVSGGFYNSTTCATGAGGGSGLATAAMFLANLTGFSSTVWADGLAPGGAYPGLTGN